MLQHTTLRAFTDTTLTDVDALTDRLAHIRRDGFSVTRGEVDHDVLGVAAPIRDDTGTVVAALSVAALASRVPADREADVVEAVVTSAGAITARSLGDHRLTWARHGGRVPPARSTSTMAWDGRGRGRPCRRRPSAAVHHRLHCWEREGTTSSPPEEDDSDDPVTSPAISPVTSPATDTAGAPEAHVRADDGWSVWEETRHSAATGPDGWR